MYELINYMLFHIIGRLTDVRNQLLTLNLSVFYFIFHLHEIPQAQTKYPWLQNEHQLNQPPPAVKGREWM